MLYKQCPRTEVHEKHYYISAIAPLGKDGRVHLVIHQDLDPKDYAYFIEKNGEQWEVRCLGVRREIKR